MESYIENTEAPAFGDDKVNLPSYQSHKIVQAAKIISAKFHPSGVLFTLEAFGDPRSAQVKQAPTVLVSPEYVHKHQPGASSDDFVGGYFVRYQDGYESWSPAETFEQGHTKVIDAYALEIVGEETARLYNPNPSDLGRQIHEHKCSTLNRKHLRVFPAGDADPVNGAHYEYVIQVVKFGETSEDPDKILNATQLKFHKGDVSEGPTGISDQALIAVVLDRYRGFQKGEFANRHNAIIITELENVLDRMHRLYREWSAGENNGK